MGNVSEGVLADPSLCCVETNWGCVTVERHAEYSHQDGPVVLRAGSNRAADIEHGLPALIQGIDTKHRHKGLKLR